MDVYDHDHMEKTPFENSNKNQAEQIKEIGNVCS